MTTLPPPAVVAAHPRRPWRHFAYLVVTAVLVAASFQAAEWDFGALLDAERRAIAMERMWDWAVAFSSPDLSAETLALGLALTLQTLAAAALGTALAVGFGYLLGMGSSRAVCVGEEHAQGFWRSFPLRRPAALVCTLCRLVQDVLRAVPDFVWAIILVAVLGLGPLTGALALTLNVTGILAKVYSELWDSVDEREYEQVRALGAGRLATFLYGIRPLAARSVLSFTLMRAECAIRNAAVIGVVGGGGLGADIWYQIGLNRWDKASTLILFTLLLTLSADLASHFVRRQLRNDPNHPRARRRRGALAMLARGYVGAAFVAAIVAWSVWFMAAGPNAPPGQQPKNFLEPAVKLLQGESWGNLRLFERLLAPELDAEALGHGDAEQVARLAAEGKVVDLSATPAWHQAWRPAAWAAWDEELDKWFVWRVVKSSALPLAMAIVGTLLGVLLGMLLTYPHSVAFQLEPSKFTGEAPAVLVRVRRALQLVLARGVGLFARGVPEVMWAFLFIAFFGPGLLAGTVAIAIHSAGVLVRVFGETVDNIPYRRFEQAFAGSRMTCFACIAGPMSFRDWMTYSFFQFESNVRAAVVLGIVGVGGLGFAFSFNFEFFRFEKASTYLLMIVVLTIVIDRISRLLQLSRVGR